MTDNGARAALTVARAQGSYNILTGAWALVSMRSFEALLGPKVDRWLVKTVSGLLLSTGAVQVGADRAAVPTVRRLSVMTAATLLTVDCTYAVRGRIAKTYLIDALVQAGFIAAWLKAARADGS
ncbi:MAG: hypothetical protein ACTHJJ_02885 [Intrasporangium sp.]|uniref:hypothetical protein n=1 Tax=Intrasporangium sp. TaxID=1925024 RepID=UPI003F7D4174